MLFFNFWLWHVYVRSWVYGINYQLLNVALVQNKNALLVAGR